MLVKGGCLAARSKDGSLASKFPNFSQNRSKNLLNKKMWSFVARRRAEVQRFREWFDYSRLKVSFSWFENGSLEAAAGEPGEKVYFLSQGKLLFYRSWHL